jgi:glutamate-ammonia-ligase adenylyltransferase
MSTAWSDAINALPTLLQHEAALAHENLFGVLSDEQRSAFQALLDNDTLFAARFAKLIACSQFAAQLCRRFPDWLLTLQLSGELNESIPASQWRERLCKQIDVDTAEALDKALREFRNREFLRIIWRDLNRLATTTEITADISAVAETCIQAALDFHYRKLQTEWGTPRSTHDGSAQPFIVLGMGKLGANELNLSSDIDLIFAYPESGETQSGETDGAKSVPNQEFFIRLGQRLIKSLDQNTADGFVFRVDMRLRPYGDSGALVLNFDALVEYYQDQGRDWERYAMIKARPVAESSFAATDRYGERLIELLRPFTYRRYLDYSAFDALREMKRLIQREVQRRRLHDNIKLGPGGIREIEFIAQCFQLIRGGREPRLQERNLQSVLQALAALAYLPQLVVDELQAAYFFLRNTEHAIQAWQDQQSQELPKAETPRAALAYALGFSEWPSFLEELNKHRAVVGSHFKNVIADPNETDEQSTSTGNWQSLWLDKELSTEQFAEQLTAHGYDNGEEVARNLYILRNSKAAQHLQSTARERFDNFMPLLLQAAAQIDKPSTALLRALPLVESVIRRTAYLVLLIENPPALRELIALCIASPWVATLLARHPVLLDELLNAGTLYAPPQKTELQRDLQQQILRIGKNDLEGQMEALRYFKLAHVLRVIASEIKGTLPLMKVSDYLTWIAEVILEYVLDLAWSHLIEKHGAPMKADGTVCNKDFIVVGYGKLGGIELSHTSDLDLVFIHNADATLSTNGAVSIDNNTFFTRLGQRIIHILTAQTSMGALYEVDMRLRPSGNSGLLVSSLKAFSDYQHNQAWTWEHQALVRARVVAGDRELANAFEKVRHDVLCKSRDLTKLRGDVIEMRNKMRDQLRPRDTETAENPVFDLKHGTGAIVDIEFMVQYAVLAWAHEHPALTQWTDNIRILETLAAEKLLACDSVEALIEAYKSYRSCAHRLSLQQQKGRAAIAEFNQARLTVINIWNTLFN